MGWNVDDLPAQHRNQVREKLLTRPGVQALEGTHKYRAQPTVVGDIRFDSKWEAEYYQRLCLRVSSGEVIYFLRQVPIHLPGRVTMRIDFLEFHADGTHHYVDAKGYVTPNWRDKKKIAESLYPITIEVVTR